jgi:hypothetical protein
MNIFDAAIDRREAACTRIVKLEVEAYLSAQRRRRHAGQRIVNADKSLME